MREWREIVLGEVIDVTHGYAFKGKFFEPDGAMRLVTPGNFLEGGGFRDRGSAQKSYSGPVPAQYVLQEGEVVVAMTEQSPGLLGSSGLVPQSGKWLHNQRIGRVCLRDTETSLLYIYYLFNAPFVRDQINASATGTKVRHTAPERLLAIRVQCPDLQTQTFIAELLASFDRLIAINERRIELLEKVAQSLYYEWFVRLRFPGYEKAILVESELGMIPDGWEMRKLGEVCSLVQAGGTPSRSDRANWDEGTISWFKTGELQDAPLTHSAEKVTAYARARLFEPPAILMAIYGSPTVGRLGWLTCTASCNQAALTLRGNRPDIEQDWLWYQLKALRAQFNTISQGAAQQNISKDKVIKTRVLLPAAEVLSAFASNILPIRKLWHELTMDNETLAAARDLLLPRLVTGRLDISDIDLGDLLGEDAA